jgi:hypothetical protein
MNKDQQAAHDQAGSSHVLIARENPDVADLIHAQREADAERFHIPLWLLTKPVAPHMQECPSELDTGVPTA